jgi:hypothetical protein
MKTYPVIYKGQSAGPDADWNNSFWQSVKSISLDNAHPESSRHLPRTKAKAVYDDRSIRVIFRVRDQYVRAITTQTHGSVYKDSCVEFFFAPDSKAPLSYFNLEMNCCGILLAHHYTGPRKNSRPLEIKDCQKIQIASSLSGPICDEIVTPITWTVELVLPYEAITPYANFDKPAPGVLWRGNFYKCADDSSCPHWLMWSPVPSEKPDFHRPDSFGQIQFV